MDCKRAERLMDAYCDCELEALVASELKHHLARCDNCQIQEQNVLRLKSAALAQPHAAPEHLRSTIAGRISEPRESLTKQNLREKWMKKARWGLATAALTAALVLAMMVGSGGNAYAALEKMQTAVGEITSAHMRVTVMPGMADLGEIDKELPVPLMGDGPLVVDAYSQEGMWRVDVPAVGVKASFDGSQMRVSMGGSVLHVQDAEQGEQVENIAETVRGELVKELNKLRDDYDAEILGTETIGGRTYQKLQVTGIKDRDKLMRLLYWVEPGSGLPGRMEVYSQLDGKEAMIVKVECTYNVNYPSYFFSGQEPAAEAE